MIKKIVIVLSRIVGVALVGLTIYTLVDSWDDMSSIELSSLILVPFFVLAVLANLYATGRMFDSNLRPYGIDLTPLESFRLASITRFTNYASFGQAGFILRSYYLKSSHGFQIKKSLAITGISTAMFYLVNAVFLSIVVWSLDVTSVEQNLIATSAYAVIALMLVLTLLSLERVYSKIWFAKEFFDRIFSDWNMQSYLKTLVWAAGSATTAILMTYIEMRVFAVSIGVASAIFISSIVSLTVLFNVTPAGIGVNEGLFLVGGGIVGIPSEILLSVAIFRRIVVFSTVAIISALSTKPLFGVSLSSARNIAKRS